MPKQHLIFGPPGTGKTTRLLEIVAEAVKRGVPSDRIGYLAFTKRAALEARQRANLPGVAPWFRTVHSLCFQCTRMTRQRMIGRDNWQDFERAYGLRLGRAAGYEPSVEDDGLGATLLHIFDQARIRGQTLRRRYETMMPDDISLSELQEFAKVYGEYKLSNSVYDFTDLLRLFMVDPTALPPRLDLLIIDEAQDLSMLQWQVINKVVRLSGTKYVYVAGDDDQAIFRWAGADTDRFLKLTGSREVLSQSYRVPQSIHSLAVAVAERISIRQEKRWRATRNKGSVSFHADAADIDYSKGEWLILARDNYLLQPTVEELKDSGLLYVRNFEPALPPGSMEAIHAWERIRKGLHRPGDRRSVQQMQTQRGKKKFSAVPPKKMPPWYEALDKLDDRDITYLRTALRKGEDTRNPRIRVSTIHGAKGAQADNVALITDISPRAAEEMETRPDDEHRVLYVGLTRARKRLCLVEPSTSNHFDIGA